MRPTQIVPNPRANSNLKRTNAAPKPVIKKEIRKPASTENTTMDDDDEMTQLRDQLMETHNLEDVSLTKLVRLQQTMNLYIQNCFKNHSYTQAKEAQQLNDELRKEISRQAQILDDHRSKMRALQNYQNYKNPSKYVYKKIIIIEIKSNIYIHKYIWFNF